eukprot:m.265433 g.265433  ORF g.265433 m.265433 type:complete len:79 (-) comp29009_c0_seq1:441-677(-)
MARVISLLLAAIVPCLCAGTPVLGGYDVVAYFTASQPTKGSSNYTASYRNYTFQFASSTNANIFKANPSKYAPAYGGY